MKTLTVTLSITVAILIGGCGDNGGSTKNNKETSSPQNSNADTYREQPTSNSTDNNTDTNQEATEPISNIDTQIELDGNNTDIHRQQSTSTDANPSTDIDTTINSNTTYNNQQSTELINNIDVQSGLDGYTILISDPTNITPNFKEDYFVFTGGNKVKFVENRDNDDQFVFDGTYEVKTTTGFGNIIDISYKKGDINSSTVIELDDSYHIKPEQLSKFPATVYRNENNGLIIKNNISATGNNVLTVNSPDDLKGYTIISNESHAGSGAFTATQTITIKFDCDGTFTQITKTSLSGQPDDIEKDSGSDIEVEEDKLSYGGEFISLDNNHQIVGGKTCFMDSTGECTNNLYVKSITQDDTCN